MGSSENHCTEYKNSCSCSCIKWWYYTVIFYLIILLEFLKNFEQMLLYSKTYVSPSMPDHLYGVLVARSSFIFILMHQNCVVDTLLNFTGIWFCNPLSPYSTTECLVNHFSVLPRNICFHLYYCYRKYIWHRKNTGGS